MADAQTAQELQEERERSQKMKQENQVLLKKLHDVVGRYRQLQQQYQSMVSERQDQQQQSTDGAGAAATSNAAGDATKAGDASPTNSSSADDAATKKLEAEKHELIEKLKQVVGTCRIMQKQLQEAKEENEILRSPAKPPGSITGGGAFSPSRSSDTETAMEALQIRVINLERDLAQKEEEKEEIVGKLKEVISRYQSLQRQLEEKVGEHDAATSKIAALELELRTQQSASASSSTTSTVGWMRRGSGNNKNNNDDHAKDKEIAKLKDDAQKLAVAVTQEEARTAVLREENARLKEQVTSILQEKEQLERDYSAEHSGSAKQLADVQRELKLMRKQQEDAEQLYLEVASKLNHTLRENGDLQSRLKSLQSSIDEADKLREQTKHDHAVEVEKLKEQLERATVSVSEASSQSGKLAELKTQLEALTARDKTLSQVERELTNFEVVSITELVAKKDAAHQEQCTELQRRVEELNKSLSSADEVSGTRQEQLDAAMKRIQELSVAADHASDLQTEVEALRSSGSDRSAAIAKMEETIATLRADLAQKQEELTLAQHTWDSNSAATSTELESLREEIEKLQAQLATASESSASTAEQISTLQHDLTHALEASESLRSDLKTKSDSLQEMEGKFQSLTESLTHKESELLVATNALEEAKKHVEDLRASRAGESEVLAALQAEVSDLRSQHAHDLAAKDASSEESIKQLKADHERAISELQSRIEKLSADNELQVEAHTKEVQSVRGLCEALEGEKAELALTKTKLQEQLSATEERVTSEKHAMQTEFSARISELEEQVTAREGDVTALRSEAEKLTADLSSLRDEHTLLLNTAGDSTKELSVSHEATLAARREEYDEAVSKLEARIAEKDEQMGKLRVEVASLQTQVMTMEAQQLQVDAESAELENELRERIAVLERECDAAKKEAADLLEEKDSLQVQVSQLMEEQESTLMQKEETEHMCREHEEENEFLRGEVEELRSEVTRTHQLVERYAGEITAVHEQLSTVPVLQENVDSGREEIDSIRRVNVDLVLKSVHARLARTEELESELKELTLSMKAQQEELTAAVAALSHAQSQADEGIAEMESLKIQLQSVETEKDVLATEVESSRQRLQTQTETIAKLEADITAIHQEKEAEVSNSMTVASEKLSEVASRLQETESELVAIKAENTRMVFEVAKTTDSAVKLKQDFEELQVQWKAKCEHAEQLETKIRELESAKTKLEEDMQSGVTSIEQLREELAAAQEATASLQVESAQALEERVKNVQRLEYEVSSMSEERETLRRELQFTTARVETLTEELSGLKDHSTSTKEERLLLEEQLADARAISQKLEEKLEEMTKANSKLTADLGTAETSLKQLQDEMSAMHKTRQEEVLIANRALEEKTGLVDSLHQMVAKTNQRSESLAYELESTKIELSALSEEVSEWKSKVELVEEEKSTIADQLATTSAEKQALADELLALQDTDTQQINVLEAKVDAKTAELHELNALLSTVQQEKSDLQEEMQSLRGQLDEHSSALSDHSAHLEAAKQELIIELDSLKSANQTLRAEKDTLSATVLSLEEAASTVNSQLTEARNSIAVSSEQLSALEAQVSDLTTQLEAKDQKLIDATERWRQHEEAARADQEERTNLLTKVSEMTSEVVKKDEIISKLKTKTEEVVGMYKKLKEHTQELQERFSEKSAVIVKLQEECDDLKTTNQTLSDESAAAAAKLTAVEEELSGAKIQLGQLQEQLATSVGSKSDELAAARGELEAIQSKLEKLTSDHEAKWAAQEAELATRSASVEREKAEFAATIAAKDVENQEVVDKMKELLTRYRELQEQHRQLEEEVTRTKSELDHSIAELAAFRTEQSGSGAAHEKALAELQGEIASLRAQLDIEIEGSNAARTALEVYKKRAATALKKATHESKSSIKKVEEETSQLQDEVNAANARVVALEVELEQAKKLLAEARAVAEVQIRTVKEKVEDERVREEASWKQQLEMIQTELSGVQAELLAKAHLDTRIDELVANNESLQTEIEALKKEVQQKSEVAREMMKVKDGEIAMLTKQLEEATRTAATNAEQLKKAQDELKEAVRAASAGRTTCSVASPRRATEEEESNHLAAVMADVKPSIQLSTSGSNGTAVDGQILKIARAQAMRDEEATKSKKQMHTLEGQVHLYQKKYEDALALLEESNRQKRRIQELSARTTDGLNIEYLKNVVIKYIESQNQSEKDRLIPVIATVLHFSPQEVKRINDVQTKAHEESAGLLGGVFSLFGAAPAAPAPKPLAIPHNLNLKQPSPNAHGVLGGAQEEDEEDHLTPLNPFASNNY